VIAALVNSHRWRVGVVAQSHSVVENLLDEIVAAGVPPAAGRQEVTKSARARPREWQPIKKPTTGLHRRGRRLRDRRHGMDFANPGRVPPAAWSCWSSRSRPVLLANTIAVARLPAISSSSRSQQLPQVSQAHTPNQSRSQRWAGWSTARHLDPSLGYFLARSWRMHQPCAVRCRGFPTAKADLSRGGHRCPPLSGREPGVHEIAVEHDGNSTDSAEEAEHIVADITALLGSQWDR